MKSMWIDYVDLEKRKKNEEEQEEEENKDENKKMEEDGVGGRLKSIWIGNIC